MVAQSLLVAPNNPQQFQAALASKLRWWLAALPAGVGLATARSILKLWLGFPPNHSGVASAGNGPAMRSAVIGVFFSQDAARRLKYVESSTRLTHTDPRAFIGALAVVEMSAWGCSTHDSSPIAVLRNLSPLSEWQNLVGHIEIALAEHISVQDFADRLGLLNGVTGYVFHTVPVAIYAWLRHRGDFRGAIEAALNCGGDTDTVGAITGALAGADLGADLIPNNLKAGIVEWPRSVQWLYRLAEKLEQQLKSEYPLGDLPLFWPALPVRNLWFLGIVLTHGFFRLIPRF
jgi:ADP-ribosylglycohydrolase